MAKVAVKGKDTAADPWVLKTPPGTSEYKMYRDEAADPPALVCVVGTTKLAYHLRCIEDLHAMLKKHGDWMFLGSADEQKPAAEGTVEAWALTWLLVVGVSHPPVCLREIPMGQDRMTELTYVRSSTE